MPTVRLTKRVVEGQPPADHDGILWDSEVTGFGCKITPAGRRSYFCYYRTRDGGRQGPAGGGGHAPARPAWPADRAASPRDRPRVAGEPRCRRRSEPGSVPGAPGAEHGPAVRPV